MPELPEVEALCRQLASVLEGAEIRSVTVCDRKLGNFPNFPGGCVNGVWREGKRIVIHLDGGASVVIHLRMTGRLRWVTDRKEMDHKRMTLSFDRGTLCLLDPRRFATVSIEYGLEPDLTRGLADGLDASTFFAAAERRRMPIKAFLMDQRVYAGIGNIYACEILYESQISPFRTAGSVSLRDWRKIVRSARKILQKAVECRGTSVSDWADLFGNKGEFQLKLRVYRRAGLPCRRCGAAIIRDVLHGRGTYYCPTCQAV